MRLRSRPLLFAHMFADAATVRPMLRGLLDLRRGHQMPPATVSAPIGAESPLAFPVPRAA